MTKQEMAGLIDQYGGDIPENVIGNEANPIIADRLKDVVHGNRAALVELLRDWIGVRIPESQRKPGDGVREGKLWLALELVERYTLTELLPDIEALIADVRAGKTYLPYYVDTIESYLRGLPRLSSSQRHWDAH